MYSPLELITRQAPILVPYGKIHISQWVKPMVGSGNIRDLVDPRIERNYDENNAWNALVVAMESVRMASKFRPTMSFVLAELECLAYEHSNQKCWGEAVFEIQ